MEFVMLLMLCCVVFNKILSPLWTLKLNILTFTVCNILPNSTTAQEMFSVSFNSTPVFIMDNNGDISQAIDGQLIYNGRSMRFLEQDGRYSYLEFFEEGLWPDEYYEDEEISSSYQGSMQLMMATGGWCDNISDLIQSIGYMSDFLSFNEEDEETVLGYISILKEYIQNIPNDRYMLKNYEGEELGEDDYEVLEGTMIW